MSTLLQEAMDRAKAAKTTQSGKRGGVPVLDVNQILERLKAVTAMREQVVAGKELSEDVIRAAEAITAEQQRRRSDIGQIEAAVKTKALLAETGNVLVAALQDEIVEWSQHMKVMLAEYPQLPIWIAKRAVFSSRVAELAAKLASFKVGETRFGDISSLAKESEHSQVIRHDPSGKGLIIFGFGRDAVSYGPASEDPVVQQFVTDFAAFVQQFNAAGDKLRDTRRSEVEEFLLDKDKISILKDHEGTVKGLLSFFSGQGQYCFIPVIGHDPRTGQERFEGEILLERRSGEMVATKATAQHLAHRVFGYMDRSSGAWKRHGVQKVVALRTDEGAGYDLDGIRNNTLREALQTKLVKDRAWKDTRDAAQRLRDISTVEGKVITMAELFRSEKGTCVANVRLRVGSDKHVWATMHVKSDGEQAHISAYTPDDLTKVVSWLGTYLEPKDMAMFRQDKQWQFIATANQGFEADWLMRQEVEKRHAVVLSAENVDGLCSADNGADGIYAIDRAQSGKFRTPLRFVMERKGSEVSVVWAAPGTSWRLMHDSVGESLLGKFFPVADMPKPIRDTLRNQYRYFKGLGGDAGFQQVPVHLKTSDVGQTGDEEVGAGNGHDEEDSR